MGHQVEHIESTLPEISCAGTCRLRVGRGPVAAADRDRIGERTAADDKRRGEGAPSRNHDHFQGRGNWCTLATLEKGRFYTSIGAEPHDQGAH